MPTLFFGDKFVCLLYLLAERERKLHNIPTLQAVNVLDEDFGGVGKILQILSMLL